jgi:hypothetical protein
MNHSSGIIHVLARNKITNLAIEIKNLLIEYQTRKAYNLLNSIREIGPKIASLYMRDIVYLGKIDESDIRDAFVLQPIDTWIDQILDIIL